MTRLSLLKAEPRMKHGRIKNATLFTSAPELKKKVKEYLAEMAAKMNYLIKGITKGSESK